MAKRTTRSKRQSEARGGEREWTNYQHWEEWWVRVSVAVHIEKKKQHKSVLKTPDNRKTTSRIAFPCRWTLCLCERTDKIFSCCFIALFCFVFCAPSSYFFLSSLTFHLILLILFRFRVFCFFLKVLKPFILLLFYCIAIWIFAFGHFCAEWIRFALCIWSLNSDECVLCILSMTKEIAEESGCSK